MKAQLTQEAKDAIIEALKLKLAKNSPTDTDWELGFESAIAEVESITVSDGWIPVSERLPEDCETVIATDGENSVPVTYINKLFYFIGSPAQFYLVTAWQPLPNPPTSHR